MTQRDVLLAALRRGERLTVAEALSKYDCYALSQRIGELKLTHPEIETETLKLGNGKRVARYYIRQTELELA